MSRRSELRRWLAELMEWADELAEQLPKDHPSRTEYQSWLDGSLSVVEDQVGAMHYNARKTEQEAAWSAYPRVGTDMHTVLSLLYEAGDRGLTDWDLRVLMHRTTSNSPNARRNQLMNGGWIMDSGMERLTVNNAYAAVWVLTPHGRRAFAEGRGL